MKKLGYLIITIATIGLSWIIINQFAARPIKDAQPQLATAQPALAEPVVVRQAPILQPAPERATTQIDLAEPNARSAPINFKLADGSSTNFSKIPSRFWADIVLSTNELDWDWVKPGNKVVSQRIVQSIQAGNEIVRELKARDLSYAGLDGIRRGMARTFSSRVVAISVALHRGKSDERTAFQQLDTLDDQLATYR